MITTTCWMAWIGTALPLAGRGPLPVVTTTSTPAATAAAQRDIWEVSPVGRPDTHRPHASGWPVPERGRSGVTRREEAGHGDALRGLRQRLRQGVRGDRGRRPAHLRQLRVRHPADGPDLRALRVPRDRARD